MAVLALLSLLVGLGGCGAGTQGQPAVATTTQHSAGQADKASNLVRVGLLEWSIPTSVSRVHPGKVTLIVTNTGGTQHDLVVQGRRGKWATRPLEPGDHARLVIHAAPSETLHLWCSEPGHRAQGMHTKLHVLTH
jgi:uncharacterized cupredoxin-like copper-binding protein